MMTACIPLRVADILEWITVDEYEIRRFSGLDRAEFVSQSQKSGSIRGRRLQRFHSRQTGLGEQHQLIVQTETRHQIRPRHIGSCQKLHTGVT